MMFSIYSNFETKKKENKETICQCFIFDAGAPPYVAETGGDSLISCLGKASDAFDYTIVADFLPDHFVAHYPRRQLRCQSVSQGSGLNFNKINKENIALSLPETSHFEEQPNGNDCNSTKYNRKTHRGSHFSEVLVNKIW